MCFWVEFSTFFKRTSAGGLIPLLHSSGLNLITSMDLSMDEPRKLKCAMESIELVHFMMHTPSIVGRTQMNDTTGHDSFRPCNQHN